MQAEPKLSNTQAVPADTGAGILCPNCRAQMPREMRFCRACGFRLGEGVAEFTETARFQPSVTAAARAKDTGAGAAKATTASAATGDSAAASLKWKTCGTPKDWGALARDVGQNAIRSATNHLEGKRQKPEQREKQCSRSKWTGWLIAIVIFSVLSSSGFIGLSGLRDRLRGSSSSSEASRSWFGSSDFQEADNGVTFEQVEPAGSPADKAGLVGGDVITTFDNQPVKSPRELRRLLTATPVGKTVEVVYIRDGETRNTQLTTVSKGEMERLGEVADNRVRGFVGIGNDSELIQIPGTNITGVQLNGVRRNNPAYIAGMRDGDIVIEFDGVPVRTYDELESRTRRAAPDSTVKVVLMRGTERRELLIKVGIAD